MPRLCRLFGGDNDTIGELKDMLLFPPHDGVPENYVTCESPKIFAKFLTYRGADTTETSAILSDGQILRNGGSVLCLLPVDPSLFLLPLLLPTLDTHEFRALDDLLDLLLARAKPEEKDDLRESYGQLFTMLQESHWNAVAEVDDVCGDKFYRLSEEKVAALFAAKAAVGGWSLMSDFLPSPLKRRLVPGETVGAHKRPSECSSAAKRSEKMVDQTVAITKKKVRRNSSNLPSQPKLQF